MALLDNWQFLAFIASMLTAVYIHINHKFKVSGLVLVLLRGLFMVLALLPVAVFLGLPDVGVSFYFMSVLIGLIVVIGDKFLLDAAAVHGGRLTSLFISMKMFVVFTAWSIIQPASIAPLLENGWAMAGVVGCYFMMVAAMNSMRAHDGTVKAILAIIPAVIALGTSDIFSKKALGTMEGLDVLIWFLLVTQIGCVLGSSAWLYPKLRYQTATIFNRDNIKGALVMLVPFTFMIGFFLSAIARAPNPGYVGAITVLTTVWLTIYYKITQDDSASWRSSLVLVIAAMILAYLTA